MNTRCIGIPADSLNQTCAICEHDVGEQPHHVCEALRTNPPNRNSPEALQQRLTRAGDMLVSALNLIGAMQPVVSAVERFFDNDTETIAGMGYAIASYHDFIKANATTLPSQALRRTNQRGSERETEQARPAHVTVG